MGDRGNIVVLQRTYSGKDTPDPAPAQIWLYSHWGGTDLPNALHKALKMYPGRWDDDSYLTRGILMNMVPKDSHFEETGSGISTQITDNEHDILVCDVPKQRVFIIKESELKDGRVPVEFEPTDTSCIWSFGQYCTEKHLPKI